MIDLFQLCKHKRLPGCIVFVRMEKESSKLVARNQKQLGLKVFGDPMKITSKKSRNT